MLSITRSASGMRYGEDRTRANTSNTSKVNTAEIFKTSWLTTSSPTSRSVQSSTPGAASNDTMQRWLGQDSKDEPWYYDGRRADDILEDSDAKMKIEKGEV